MPAIGGRPKKPRDPDRAARPALKNLPDLLGGIDRAKALKYDPELAKKVVEDVWLPFLEDMMAVDAQIALEASVEGSKARELIYKYALGKPVEQVQQQPATKITIGFITVDSKEKIPEIQQKIIDGEYRIVSDITQIHVALPEAKQEAGNEGLKQEQTEANKQEKTNTQSGECVACNT